MAREKYPWTSHENYSFAKIKKELTMRKEECSHSCRMGPSSFPKELYAAGRIFHFIELRHSEQTRALRS